MVAERHEVLQLFGLMIGESLAGLLLAVERASQFVAGVADRLQFADLAHHLANLLFRLVTQMPLAHLLQVAGNLYLYLVSHVFLVLYLPEEFGKILWICLME